MGVVYSGWSRFLLLLSVISLVCSWQLGMDRSVCLEYPVLSVGSEMVDLVVVLDLLSMSFVSLVCLISGCVVLYSMSYMSSEGGASMRFLVLLVFFVVSMVLLILVPSVLGVIIGWDGLGVSSFLLVVYYQNSLSLASGMLTALSNRVGDGLIVTSMGVCLLEGSWSMYYLSGVGVGFCVLLALAGMTKSAQMPFCAWLPAAMAAPTPVSSLVHSSTLVTAGVYLLLRFSECLVGKGVMDLLLVLSSLTMFMAGVSAIFEKDSKKVVALSTLSQLGMMFFVLSMGFPMLCLFHVYMHALLKALLFMGVGAMIHSREEQDINEMGASWVDSPASSGFIVLACLALAGFPFLCGFFSKDMIVEVGLGSDFGYNFYGVVLLGGVIMTCIYGFRLMWLLVFSSMNFKVISVVGDCELMVRGMGVLAVGVIVSGYTVSFWVNSHGCVVLDEVSKVLPVLCLGAVGLLGVGWLIGDNMTHMESDKSSIYKDFLAQMWFLPLLSGEVVASSTLKISDVMIEGIEMGWAEVIGGQGVASLVSEVNSFHDRCQSGMSMGLGLTVISFMVVIILSIFFSQ